MAVTSLKTNTKETGRKGVVKVKKKSMSFPFDDLSKPIYRIGRFVNCPSNLEPQIRDLAKAGFFYTGKEDKVECFSCKGVIGNWKSSDSAIAKHLQHFPNCAFAQSLTQVTDTQTSGGASAPRNTAVATNNGHLSKSLQLPIGMTEPRVGNTTTSLPNVDGAVPSTSEMRIESKRLRTFSTWPASSPVRPADLARAGLYYVGPNDRVACFYCSGVMRDWELGDVPEEEHKRHFSTCAFAMGSSNTGNIPHPQASVLPNASSASAAARTTRARSPEMGSVEARLATYRAWPLTANVAALPLAMAGFYYTGNEDNVKCFYCDGGLRNWELGDDPWHEHGKWFPRCAFLLQEKGEAFVKEIMRQHPQLRNLTGELYRQRPQNAAAENGTGNGIGSTDQDLMNSDVVKGVLEMSFRASLVESLVRSRFMTTGELYTSVVELVTDVLTAEDEEMEASKQSTSLVKEEQKPAVDKKEHKSDESIPPEEELKRLQEQHTCKVCMDKEVSVVFIPCGHLVVCQECASSLRKCPICRAVVRGTVRTFMS